MLDGMRCVLTSSPMTANRVRSFSLVAMSGCLQWSATTERNDLGRMGPVTSTRWVSSAPTERSSAAPSVSVSTPPSPTSALPSMSFSTVSDLFNRPPAISDDMLQYALYPRDGLNDRASATTLATLMRSYVDSALPGHLWHRDSFELKVFKDEDQDGWILQGRMRVGDCVDDEWCAVWLLREVSARWDVVIRLVLLICDLFLLPHLNAVCLTPMANFYLSKRLRPCRLGSPPQMLRTGYVFSPTSTSSSLITEQVWIYQSHLHLLPLSHVSAPSSKPRRSRYSQNRDSDDDKEITNSNDNEDYISVPDALMVVRDPLVDTIVPSAAEQLVWKRISG